MEEKFWEKSFIHIEIPNASKFRCHLGKESVTYFPVNSVFLLESTYGKQCPDLGKVI